MKYFYLPILRLWNTRKPNAQWPQRYMIDWCKDPLSHPDIDQMSERERADLQFDPHCIKSE